MFFSKNATASLGGRPNHVAADHDDEALCVVPRRTTDNDKASSSSSSASWTNVLVVLCAFVGGILVSPAVLNGNHAGRGGTTTTTAVAPPPIAVISDTTDHVVDSSSFLAPVNETTDYGEDDEDDKDVPDIMTMDRRELMEKLREEILQEMQLDNHHHHDDYHDFDDHLMRALTETEVPEEEDEFADEGASEADEIDWDNDIDEINIEQEKDEQAEDESQLDDYDPDLEEADDDFILTYEDMEADALDNATEASRRRLNGLGPKIQPLACNADLTTQPCTTLLSSMTNTSGSPVEIPCGQCVTVDATDGSTLWYPDGLTIKGKLYFPSTSSVTIRTKNVFVQGILKIDPPTTGNQIKFSLYKEEDSSFLSTAEPTGVCGPTACKLGSKVIAVVGGQLDIQGYDSSCPTWEKLQAVGDSHPKEFVAPTDGQGNPLELEIAGKCRESHGHSRALGKTTVWCPITSTITVRHGTREALTFTSVEPGAVQPFTPPTRGGQTMSLRVKQNCRVTWGHTRWAKKCMIYCPTYNTANIPWGHKMPLTFKSVKPPEEPFVAPSQGGTAMALKVKGRCHESRGHSYHLKRFTLRCPLEYTATIRHGSGRSLKFVNKATGKSITARSGVWHWAWAGRNMYFFPDATADEVSAIFPPGSTMDVEYLYENPGGGEFDVAGVHHWAWASRYSFFYPEGYTVDDCNNAAKDFNDLFPVGYDIEISNRRALPVEAGQTITAKKGVHHWAWSGRHLFFHPDVSVGEVNRLFPPGYRMQVAYSELTHINEVKVSPEAANCWKPGTSLVLSSHTRRLEDRQEAAVVSVDTTTGILTLDKSILRPHTLEDHPDFAVEIASLNRPVVFEADSASDEGLSTVEVVPGINVAGDLIGGHLIVFKTETFQKIEGVEVVNFGQSGRLGRYPIHFHECGSTTNSVVKKNVVRESNQRAYVAHCSDNILMEDNVAYEVPGHTFFLEAGTEIGTTFTRNLGIATKNLPSASASALGVKSKRHETDTAAAVFWISHPDNSFFGNVVAGSARHGYWFETRSWQTRHANLRAFEDNEAHSCHHFAFTSYPPGWRPSNINIIKNLKLYRNSGFTSMFLHVTRNLVFQGGIVADSGHFGVFMNRGDDVTFDGTTFIGQTPFAPKMRWCPPIHRHGGGPVGIALNPARLGDLDNRGAIRGTSLIGTKFYNWTEEATGCAHARPMSFDTMQVFTKSFQAPHEMKDVFIDTPGDKSKVDVCRLEQNLGIKDSIIHIPSDVDNTFSPTGDAGFLASAKVTTILPDGTCTDYNDCLKFCPGVCLRTVSVRTNAGQASGISMRVTDTISGKTIEVKGQLRSNEKKIADFHSTYTVALPKPSAGGFFDISFIDDATNQPVWPSYAFPVFEAPPLCTHVEPADVRFVTPDVSTCDADNIVKNGDFASNLDWWQGWMSKNEFSADRGVGGSGALVTRGDVKKMHRHFHATQWLDAYCLEEGSIYDITVSYRQIDKFGATVIGCTGTTNDCPTLDILSQTFVPSTGHYQSNWGNQVGTTDTSTYTNDQSFNTITGAWTVTAFQGSADRVRIAFGNTVDQLIIDNVVLKKRVT